MKTEISGCDERRTAMEVVDGVDLTDRICVITGATSGLGREAARALAAAVAALPEQREISAGSDIRKLEVLTPEEGAATQVWAAVSTELNGTGGVYLADCKIRSGVAPYATDRDRARRLWELSDKLCSV